MSNGGRGLHWLGDRCEPGALFVTDGHVIILKSQVHPEAVGTLALPFQIDETNTDLPDGGEPVDCRNVPDERARTLWASMLASATVPGRFGDTFRSSMGWTVIEFVREDGTSAWVSAYKALLLRGAVCWTTMKQGAALTSAIVCYQTSEELVETAVAAVMPMRYDDPTVDDPRHTPVTLTRPEGTEDELSASATHPFARERSRRAQEYPRAAG